MQQNINSVWTSLDDCLVSPDTVWLLTHHNSAPGLMLSIASTVVASSSTDHSLASSSHALDEAGEPSLWDSSPFLRPAKMDSIRDLRLHTDEDPISSSSAAHYNMATIFFDNFDEDEDNLWWIDAMYVDVFKQRRPRVFRDRSNLLTELDGDEFRVRERLRKHVYG